MEDVMSETSENIIKTTMPRIGDPAPSFEAETTFGKIHLDDF
jgi:hypothetical protein